MFYSWEILNRFSRCEYEPHDCLFQGAHAFGEVWSHAGYQRGWGLFSDSPFFMASFFFPP
jgi:hypothetical protein